MKVFKAVAVIMVLGFLASFPLKRYFTKKYISWVPGQKLSWLDFKGSQPKGFHHNAGTGCYYYYNDDLIQDSLEIEVDN